MASHLILSKDPSKHFSPLGLLTQMVLYQDCITAPSQSLRNVGLLLVLGEGWELAMGIY